MPPDRKKRTTSPTRHFALHHQATAPSPSSGSPAEMLPSPSTSGNLVELNVGGMFLVMVPTTSRTTLEDSQPQSMLAALVSGRHGPPCRDAQVMTCLFFILPLVIACSRE